MGAGRQRLLAVSAAHGLRITGHPTVYNLALRGIHPRPLSYEGLKAEYNRIVCRLPREASQPTTHELAIRRTMRATIKTRPLFNCWIGPYNADIFFYQYGGSAKNLELKTYRGIIIEIDGDIHLTESKMRKDMSRVDYFAQLGLCVCSINNNDISSASITRLLYEVNRFHRNSSRTVRRLLTRIYLETLCAHLGEREFGDLFKLEAPHV